MSQTDRTDALTPDMFSAVARNVFGSTTQVSSVEKLKHGVDNQPYKITLHGHDRIYVFRFRRWRQDNYQHEIQNYERIHKLTGIDVPTVHCLDQSEKIVPTAYMVMDYMEGVEAGEVSRGQKGQRPAADRALHCPSAPGYARH
jgi:aminoglycoside phosphotransferase (APT) family kinase protein